MTNKEKSLVYERIVKNVSDAFDKNLDVLYIENIFLYEQLITFKLVKDDWIKCTNKARLFFEQEEDYVNCKICRDLITEIKAIG